MKKLYSVLRINIFFILFLLSFMIKFGYAMPMLGIRSDEFPVENGIVITRIHHSMPAGKAGLLVGDILSEVRLASGISLSPVKNLDELQNFLKNQCKSGEKIELVVYRGSKRIVNSLQLVESDPQFIGLLPILIDEWLGKDIAEDISENTVRLTWNDSTISLSPYMKPYFSEVQFITKVDTKEKGELYPADDLVSLESYLSRLHSGSTITFFLASGEKKVLVLPQKTYDYQLLKEADKYFRKGDKSKACQLYIDYYSRYPKTWLAYISCAQSVECLLNLGKRKEAIIMAQDYFRQEPDQQLEKPTAMIIDSINKTFTQDESARNILNLIKESAKCRDNKTITKQLENLIHLN